MRVNVIKWDPACKDWILKQSFKGYLIKFKAGYLHCYKKPKNGLAEPKPDWAYKICEGEKIVWREDD